MTVLSVFRPANSIYVDAIVTVNKLTGSSQDILNKLNSTVQGGWIQNLAVNSDFFMASVGSKYMCV